MSRITVAVVSIVALAAGLGSQGWGKGHACPHGMHWGKNPKTGHDGCVSSHANPNEPDHVKQEREALHDIDAAWQEYRNAASRRGSAQLRMEGAQSRLGQCTQFCDNHTAQGEINQHGSEMDHESNLMNSAAEKCKAAMARLHGAHAAGKPHGHRPTHSQHQSCPGNSLGGEGRACPKGWHRMMNKCIKNK